MGRGLTPRRCDGCCCRRGEGLAWLPGGGTRHGARREAAPAPAASAQMTARASVPTRPAMRSVRAFQLSSRHFQRRTLSRWGGVEAVEGVHNNLGRYGCWPCCSCSDSSAIPALLPASRTALVSPTLRLLAVLSETLERAPPPTLAPTPWRWLWSVWPPTTRLPQPGSTPTASRSRRTVATSSSWVMSTTGAHRHIIFCCSASPPAMGARPLL